MRNHTLSLAVLACLSALGIPPCGDEAQAQDRVIHGNVIAWERQTSPPRAPDGLAHSEQGDFLAGISPFGPNLGGEGGIGEIAPDPCAADWDNNDVLNAMDVATFFNDYVIDMALGTNDADFNQDGMTTSSDVVDFLNAWFSGC